MFSELKPPFWKRTLPVAIFANYYQWMRKNA
jgi:hypothetical protein